MSDVRLIFDESLLAADLTVQDADLERDDGLETAVIVSLFSDRRANADDILPAGADDDRRGWWGDAVPPSIDGEEKAGDRIGSRLWLLAREKQLPEVIERARDYVREALAWLIDDGLAERIDVEAEIYAPGTLAFSATIWRPGSSAVDFRYHYAWEAQAARRVA